MRSSTLVILLIALFALTTEASPTSLGCVAPGVLNNLLGALLGGTYNNITSVSGCTVSSLLESVWVSTLSLLRSTRLTMGRINVWPLTVDSRIGVPAIFVVTVQIAESTPTNSLRVL